MVRVRGVGVGFLVRRGGLSEIKIEALQALSMRTDNRPSRRGKYPRNEV